MNTYQTPILSFKSHVKHGLLIAVLSTIGLSGCATSYKDTDPRFTHSLTQQKELDHWHQKYKANRKNSANAIGFAKALVKTKQENRALDVLETAHQQNPNDKHLTSEYGRVALMAGENKLASNLLKDASKGTKADWKILSAKGVLEARAGKNKNAIRYFKQALRHNPRQASILNNLGLAYAVTGNYRQSEKYLKQALWDTRHIRQVRQNLALVYAMQGKVKEAEAIALEPLPKKFKKVSSAAQHVRKKPVALNNFKTKVTPN
ncbi:tetratricopeptide repeat protein [Hyphomicrobiales bacterium 4NK60-0047b]